MSRYNKDLGDFGEAAAVYYVKEHGMEVIERNFCVRGGEIDIIAIDKDKLVFIEVKTRSSDRYGLPSESVDMRKIEHMKTAAERFLNENPFDGEVRFDAIEVEASISGERREVFSINHIIDILN